MDSEMDKAKGLAKEKAGEATGDRDLEAEGKVDQAKGDAKKGVDKAKDALGDLSR